MDKNQQLLELNKRIKAKFGADLLLFGKGNLNASIVLVSEYPNAQEAAKGQALLGATGQTVNKSLKSLGLTRRQIYITHAVKSAKDKNDLPNPKEIKQFSHFLREEIKIIEPKLIIALGPVALRGLNVKLPLFNIRGRLIRFGPNNLFATHHPASVSDPLSLLEIEKDFRQLSVLLKNIA